MSIANKIKVFVVDDHPIFRQGLRQVIESDPRMAVAGEAALVQIKTAKPHVAVVDIDLLGSDGLELARALRNLRPPCSRDHLDNAQGRPPGTGRARSQRPRLRPQTQCPERSGRIGSGEIRFGDLQVQDGLALSLVLGFDDLDRGILIVSPQTGALAGGGINAVESVAPDSTSN